ncbi:hypothetical protein BDW71DRAFT_176829 [Aspergillus fruticulosus]
MIEKQSFPRGGAPWQKPIPTTRVESRYLVCMQDRASNRCILEMQEWREYARASFEMRTCLKCVLNVVIPSSLPHSKTSLVFTAKAV